MTFSRSLLDPPAASPFATAADWMAAILLGSVAASLCVLAIAFVGLMLISGRLAVRDGFRVVLACFVLLGAPAIAAGLRGVASEAAGGTSGEVLLQPMPEPTPLPPAQYDPYAGASLRRD
jgi:type IV secretory pathway VirB2 component (pilin)